MIARTQRQESAEQELFDVAIVGGGVNGACLYNSLCRKGYRTVLLDKGDFACGSSQASGMMIWGGLLYLKNLDIASVYRFSKARDSMIDSHRNSISPKQFRYIPGNSITRNKYFVLAALYFYWMLSLFNRRKPTSQKSFEESGLLPSEDQKSSLVFEEGFLKDSDSRFVLRWITPHQREGQVALNYCELVDGIYSGQENCWQLNTRDSISGKKAAIRSRMVVNCAGIWTDIINERFNIVTPYKHVFSKGVYVSTKKRDEHQSPLILDMGNNGDVLTYVPWGPVSMWGPTETRVDEISEGFQVTKDDIQFLLERYEKKLKDPIDKNDIISVRCGVRPLVVSRSFSKKCYPLELSRSSKITVDRTRPWVSVFGGKITGCTKVADKTERAISKYISPSLSSSDSISSLNTNIEWTEFPGMTDKVPAIEWCKRYEYCQTLDDYLRRRTNISQWIRREGLGENNEFLPWLKDAAFKLHNGDAEKANNSVAIYQRTVSDRFDSLIATL